jgi:hypothetical protein
MREKTFFGFFLALSLLALFFPRDLGAKNSEEKVLKVGIEPLGMALIKSRRNNFLSF